MMVVNMVSLISQMGDLTKLDNLSQQLGPPGNAYEICNRKLYVQLSLSIKLKILLM